MGRNFVESALRQLQAWISRMSPAHRAAARTYLTQLSETLEQYGPPVELGAAIKFFSTLAMAQAGGSVDRWKAKVAAKAAEVGPDVAAIFSAL